MNVIPCSEDLLRSVELRPDMAEMDVRESFFELWQGISDCSVYLSHWSVALVDPAGKALGVLGANLAARGVADGWAYLSHQAIAHPISLSKCAFQALRYAQEELELWRLQAVIDMAHPERLRWARHLGFQVEGVARKHLLQRDHWIVGKVF